MIPYNKLKKELRIILNKEPHEILEARPLFKGKGHSVLQNLNQEQIGSQAQFLKPGQIVKTLIYKEKTINISLPIKVHLKVIEAPPGIRAGRAEAGTKQVTLETGAKINVPLFIKEGDIIEVNTQTGEYVRRIE